MILLDANVLIYAFRKELPQHERVRDWLIRTVARDSIGVPVISELAFLRLSTKPLGPIAAAPWDQTWSFLEALLARPHVFRISPGSRHPNFFADLMERHALVGDETSDAWLAALALEQDARFATADRGFRRFVDLRIVNPIE